MKDFSGLYNISLGELFDFKDKQRQVDYYVQYMLSRTQQIFEYENLPDSLNRRIIEIYLQVNGNVCITEVDGKLYAFTGGLGGKPNVYYMPTIYTVANPALNFFKNLVIDEECVVIPSDSFYLGLLPMFKRYATMLMENDITMRLFDINSRIVSIMSCPDDRTKKSGDKYIADIENGVLGVMGESAFLDGIKVNAWGHSSSNRFTDLIEYEQYLKASWFNEIGLQSNYNMKRESINANEAQLNDDMLIPLIDDMYEQRRIGIDKINKMYGTNISVKIGSVWEEMREEIMLGEEDQNDQVK